MQVLNHPLYCSLRCFGTDKLWSQAAGRIFVPVVIEVFEDAASEITIRHYGGRSGSVEYTRGV